MRAPDLRRLCGLHWVIPRRLINFLSRNLIPESFNGWCAGRLSWKKRTLSRFPLEGYPKAYPLKIFTTGTKADKLRCEKEGDTKLATLRAKAMEGKLFDKKEDKAEYNPRYWRLVARYWYYHLRLQKTGANKRCHLARSLKKFGSRYAKKVYREDIELWRHEMRKNGAEVNTINKSLCIPAGCLLLGQYGE